MVHDERVVRRVLAGDVEVFGLLVERYQDRVLRVVRGLTDNRSDHDDLAQDVFLRAFVHLRRFDPRRGAFSSWLLTLTRNHCLNARHARRLRRVAPLPDQPAAPERSDPDIIQRRILDDALSSLPFEQRSAWVLSRIQGIRYEDIAAIEGIEIGTVRSRISRARRKLREALGPLLRSAL